MTAVVLVGFGTAVVVQRTNLELAGDGLEVLDAGLGALLGAVLARRGVTAWGETQSDRSGGDPS